MPSVLQPPHHPQPLIHTAGTSRLLDPATIAPSPWHPRHTPPALSPADLHRLTATLARQGLPHNLHVRPLPTMIPITPTSSTTPPPRYQLLFDDPHLPCALAAGLPRVPATLRRLSDRDARLLALTDILCNRHPLHCLDQSDALAGLLEAGCTAAALAAELGQSPTWIARRHRLQNLTPNWRNLAADPKGWIANWSAADFEQIALLAPPSQDALLTHPHDLDRLRRCTTFRDLHAILHAQTPALATFPWPLDDPDLLPAAGACASCPHRTSQHRDLFPDSSPLRTADRCLNPLCAAHKVQIFVDRRRRDLAAKHPQVLLLQGAPYPDIPGALREWQVTQVPRRCRGALPAVVASGRDLGRVKWVLIAPSQR